jgi:hypothetical protein
MDRKIAEPVRCWAVGVTAGLALLAAGVAARGEAAGAADALAAGRRLVQSFEYDAALEQLEAVSASADATAAQRVEALELVGVMHFSLRREPRARQVFERLLSLDPGHDLTDTSYPPRLLAFYASVRESFMPQQTVEVEAVASQEPAGTGPVRIEARIGGAAEGVAQAVTLVRAVGGTSFRRALMTRDAGGGLSFTADVPADQAEGGLEYYVEAQAPSGHALARAGTAEAPLRFEPPAPSTTAPEVGPAVAEGDDGEREQPRPRRRWYRSWWFWTIVGVAVAGGTAAAVVLTLPPEQEEGTLGTWSLP